MFCCCFFALSPCLSFLFCLAFFVWKHGKEVRLSHIILAVDRVDVRVEDSRVQSHSNLFFLCVFRIPKTIFSMEGEGVVKGGGVFLAMYNGVGFHLNDLVDVFVGTGKGVTGNKAFPIKGRFKGVRVEKGEERFLCRPIVGSQKGRCPSFPPESCLKVKAFGSDIYGERKPLFFSKLTTKVQKRSPPTP